MKKIIVTGAGGFIGHHLVSSLKSKGNFVIGVDQKWPEFEDTKANRFIIHDIRVPSQEWEDLFQGIDEVWALAADMGGMGFISKNHAAIMRDNVLINIHTLEAARKAKVKKYLYTSSACIYPDYLQTQEDASPLAEAQAYPANPAEGYGWEKLYTEMMCQHYHEEYGIDMRIVRFHNIYGPLGTWQGGREKAPAALCRKVAQAVKDKKDYIEIWGDGLQARTFCYIDDCIKGLELIMASTYTGPLNLGRDEVITINRLAELVMDITGVSLKKVYVAGPQGVRGRNSNNALLKETIGWSPEIDIETGLKLTYQWIEKQI
ncbi:MAG: NAD-dependent epimerase/dehydratase family protein [Candidatus Omnitrophica bacterium]|nr:NAD-dependent epimerase/dehydratase family protein [Candidatus Omnitrophota bacterium]